MVVDTSAILAVFFREPNAAWVAEQLNARGRALRMSTVNLAEALIRIHDRQPQLADGLEERLLTSGIRFVPPDFRQAQVAARARLAYPLNLGDCFAYALAKAEGCAILSLDADFRSLDCPVVMPP
jgi:ribonuclease VapC